MTSSLARRHHSLTEGTSQTNIPAIVTITNPKLLSKPSPSCFSNRYGHPNIPIDQTSTKVELHKTLESWEQQLDIHHHRHHITQLRVRHLTTSLELYHDATSDVPTELQMTKFRFVLSREGISIMLRICLMKS